MDATIVHGAPDGWFLPGNGKAEWFKDHEMGPEMVVVPGGKFRMGSPKTEPERGDEESPLHWVTIARPFGVATIRPHAVSSPHSSTTRLTRRKSKARWRNPGFPQDDSHPVVWVSWEDAKAFVAWLSSQSGRAYRLLTRTEWEYAADGTTTPFWWG